MNNKSEVERHRQCQVTEISSSQLCQNLREINQFSSPHHYFSSLSSSCCLTFSTWKFPFSSSNTPEFTSIECFWCENQVKIEKKENNRKRNETFWDFTLRGSLGKIGLPTILLVLDTTAWNVKSKCRRYSVIYRYGAWDWKNNPVLQTETIFSFPSSYTSYLFSYWNLPQPFLSIQLITCMILEAVIGKSNAEGCKFPAQYIAWYQRRVWFKWMRSVGAEKCARFNEFLFLFKALNVHCRTFLWYFRMKSGLNAFNNMFWWCKQTKLRRNIRGLRILSVNEYQLKWWKGRQGWSGRDVNELFLNFCDALNRHSYAKDEWDFLNFPSLFKEQRKLKSTNIFHKLSIEK